MPTTPALPGRRRPQRDAEHPPLSTGGFANAARRISFCANTTCIISVIFDQTTRHNDLTPSRPAPPAAPTPASPPTRCRSPRRPHSLRRLVLRRDGLSPPRRVGRPGERPARGHVHGRRRHPLQQRMLLRLRQRRGPGRRHRQRPHGRALLRHAVLVSRRCNAPVRGSWPTSRTACSSPTPVAARTPRTPAIARRTSPGRSRTTARTSSRSRTAVRSPAPQHALTRVHCPRPFRSATRTMHQEARSSSYRRRQQQQRDRLVFEGGDDRGLPSDATENSIQPTSSRSATAPRARSPAARSNVGSTISFRATTACCTTRYIRHQKTMRSPRDLGEQRRDRTRTTARDRPPRWQQRLRIVRVAQLPRRLPAPPRTSSCSASQRRRRAVPLRRDRSAAGRHDARALSFARSTSRPASSATSTNTVFIASNGGTNTLRRHRSVRRRRQLGRQRALAPGADRASRPASSTLRRAGRGVPAVREPPRPGRRGRHTRWHRRSRRARPWREPGAAPDQHGGVAVGVRDREEARRSDREQRVLGIEVSRPAPRGSRPRAAPRRRTA